MGTARRRAREVEFCRPPFRDSEVANRSHLLSALLRSRELFYEALEHGWDRRSCRRSIPYLKNSNVWEEIAGGIPVVQAYSYVAFARETQLCAGGLTMHHRSGHLSVERNQRGRTQLSRDNPAPRRRVVGGSDAYSDERVRLDGSDCGVAADRKGRYFLHK